MPERMKLSFLFCLFLCLILVPEADVMAQAEFIENQGQWRQELKFLTKLSHGDFWLQQTKVSFVLSDFGQADAADSKFHPHGRPSRAKFHCYEMEFLGASGSCQVQGRQPLKRYHNYYTSRSERNWRSGVPLFASAVQNDIYPGTDLFWKEESGNLKYEFVLKPGANPGNIRIRYRGLKDLKIQNQQLVLSTSIGTITEQKPLAWQIGRNGQKIGVPCLFQLHGDSTSGFEFPEGFDPGLPLVIDPILVFSSFSGSRSDNWGFTSTYGEESSPYAAGIALGPHFPVTPGAYDASFAGDSTGINMYATYDIGVLKFNPSGTELLYATYIGGPEAEAPASIVVDKDSNLIVLGTTSSSGFPVTADAFDTSYNGGSLASPYGPGEAVVQFRTGSDIVVSKFSRDGRQLLASTFLGGSANDGLLTLLQLGNSPLVKNYGDSFRGEVISDSLGRIYLASHTLSTDFPTASPIQSQLAGGADAVLVILSPGLDSLYYSTYHGGSLDDAAYSLQFGKNREVYLSGGTASPDFPASPGALHPQFSGVVDGFISRFNPVMNQQVRSTFLGTAQYDQSYFVQVDRSGNVYSYGQTTGNYPVSAGVYKNPGSAQYIHCLSGNLDSTRFSTVFGSGTASPNISPTAFLVDECGRIYCSGWGGSTNTLPGYQNGNTNGMPTTPTGGSQTTDGSDFYILVLEKNASDIVFGTYFGDSQSFGEHVDGGTSRFDKRGVIYQAVCAGCGGFSSFPTTPGVVSNVNGSTNCNNALFVYDFSKLQARYSATASGGCAPLTLKFKSVSVYDQQIRWDFDDGSAFLGNSQDSVSHTFQHPGVYKVKLVAYNPEGCPSRDSTIQTITVQEPIPFSGDTLQFCSREDTLVFPLLPQGDLTYSWEPPLFLESQAANPVRLIRPDSSLWYTATVRTSEGCSSKAKFLLRNGILQPSANADTLSGCVPLQANFYSQSLGSEKEQWIFGDGDSSAVLGSLSAVSHTFGQPGIFLVTLVTRNDTACTAVQYDSLRIRVSGGPALPDTVLRFCSEGQFQLQSPSGSASAWSWSPGNQLSDSTLANPILSQAQSNTYRLTSKDSLGCASVSSVFLRSGILRAAFSLPPVPLCAPVEIPVSNLSVNAMQSRFIWGSDSLTVPGGGSASLVFSRGGRYLVRLKVFSDTACLAEADTSITLSLGGPGNASPDEIRFCLGDTVAMQALKESGFHYFWPAPVKVEADSSLGYISPSDSTEVPLLIRDSLGCEGSARFNLQLMKPDTSITVVSEFEPCTDRLQYRFSSAGKEENTYGWYLNEDSISAASSFSYVFPQRGSYYLRLKSHIGNCTGTAVRRLEVQDEPLKLKADFDFGLLFSDCARPPQLRLTNRTEGADRHTWVWNGNFSNAGEPFVRTDGLDSVRLQLLVYKGLCLKEISKTIPLHALRPPNLLTLEENGSNDFFTIPRLPDGSAIEIRDRWGLLKFREEPFKNQWRPASEGTYFYRLKLPGGGSCQSWIEAVR